MEKRDVIYDIANQPTPFPPNSLCIHPPSFLAAGGGGGHISSRSLTPKPPFIKPPPSIVFRDRGGGEGGEGGGGQQNENFIHIFPFSSLFSPSLTGGKQMPANLGGKSGGRGDDMAFLSTSRMNKFGERSILVLSSSETLESCGNELDSYCLEFSRVLPRSFG